MGDAFHSMYSKVFTLEIIAHLYVFWIKIRWALSSTFALRDVRIICKHFHFTGILSADVIITKSPLKPSFRPSGYGLKMDESLYFTVST